MRSFKDAHYEFNYKVFSVKSFEKLWQAVFADCKRHLFDNLSRLDFGHVGMRYEEI